jgi:hypothetical protein
VSSQLREEQPAQYRAGGTSRLPQQAAARFLIFAACFAALDLALGGGGIVRRVASPQAPAPSSALGGSLVRLSS